MEEKLNYRYFQFQREKNIPIYIKYEENMFTSDLEEFLTSSLFSRLSDNDSSKVPEIIELNPNAKILALTHATPSVAKQISQRKESDHYGDESIFPNPAYNLYRYKGYAMIIYSIHAKEWQMGAFNHFGSKSMIDAPHYRSIIARYLGWCLAPMGVVGFWGVPIDDGIILMNQNKSNGEAIYVDVMSQVLFSLDGIRQLNGHFRIIKLDQRPSAKNSGNIVNMPKEELLSFLYHHCTYFSYEPFSSEICQLIQSISMMGEGHIYPEDSFRPRTDLGPL